MIQYFTCPPPAYLQDHFHQFLPQWDIAAESVLIVLQQVQEPLCAPTPRIDGYKQRCRHRFLVWAEQMTSQLQAKGYRCDIFDPRTGQPMLSEPGERCLDDAAVVQACLHYDLKPCGDCCVINHPEWGSAVYPSILMTSAPLVVLHQVTARVLGDNAVGYRTQDWAKESVV
ncbi:MAG: methylmalonic aciduria and homocystinuria type D protein [Thainema sp.]